MGNILWRRKKVVTEELESLSHQMKAFREDIEKTAEAKRMILWYLTLTTFFLSSSVIGYTWITVEKREHKVLFSILSFVAGLGLLWLGRRAANAFYNWRITRKRQALDALVARKKSLLETVKETETFKKYDQESPKSISQPSSPIPQKRSTENLGAFHTPMQERDMADSAVTGPPRAPVRKLFTKSTDNIPLSETAPLKTPVVSRLNPIRPFQREGTTVLDKMVDYFFGDGPSQRIALICSSCYGHNGMALPAEYDYLAFVCYICGQFNPARKFRPGRLPSTSSMQASPHNPRMSSSSEAHAVSTSLEHDTLAGKLDENKEKADDSFDDLSDENVPELPSGQ
ncbi:unnamed protein product [Heligmosomoides polygyrus]|uniref:Endoplasmic reticulum junction formation protein lunapark n=1 Tax=Heligmosomoides polygyrus TaxID=6339 RepID=A0A3P7XAB7_HELPZ|nr:unnamed protein product [Heligmosomoides polygyrus]